MPIDRDEDRKARARAVRIVNAAGPSGRVPQYWGPEQAKEDIEFYIARNRVIAKQRQEAEAEAKAQRQAEDEAEKAMILALIDERNNRGEH